MLVGSKLYYCCLLVVSMYVFETTCIKLFVICEILPDQSSKQESWNIWYNNKHHSLLYFYYIALQDAGWRHSRTMPFIWNCTVSVYYLFMYVLVFKVANTYTWFTWLSLDFLLTSYPPLLVYLVIECPLPNAP